MLQTKILSNIIHLLIFPFFNFALTPLSIRIGLPFFLKSVIHDFSHPGLLKVCLTSPFCCCGFASISAAPSNPSIPSRFESHKENMSSIYLVYALHVLFMNHALACLVHESRMPLMLASHTSLICLTCLAGSLAQISYMLWFSFILS